MRELLTLYKTKLCSILWTLFALESLVVIYLMSPAPIDPLVVIEPNFAVLSGDNVLFEQGKNAQYTVSVSKNLDKELNITLAYGGSAKKGIDYSAPEHIVIKKGDMNATFELRTLDDNELEGEEIITVKIANITGKNFMEALRPQDMGGVVFTKIYDEAKHERKLHKPALFSLSCESMLRENNATVSCLLKSTQKSYEPVVVDLSYSGTASLSEDFIAQEQVTIPSGESEVSFVVTAIDDAYKEGVENIVITIDAIAGGGFEERAMAHKMATIKLSDEDHSQLQTSLSINDLKSIEEGSSGTYTLALSRAPVSDVTVFFKRNNSAKKFKIPEQVIFHPGEVQKQFIIESVDDNIKERDDFIDFSIAKVEQASFEHLSYSNRAVKSKITDEAKPQDADEQTAYITLSSSNGKHSVEESVGSVTIVVTSSQAVVKDTILYLKLQEEAAQGREYTFNKKVRIKKGKREGTTTLTLHNDNIKQSSELLTISVSRMSDSGLEDLRVGQALTVEIIDDSTATKPAYISLQCPQNLYENRKKSTCKVLLSEVTQKPLSLHLKVDGEAILGVDYELQQDIEIPKGAKEARFNILVKDDIEKEGDERIILSMDPITQDYFEQLEFKDLPVTLHLKDEKKPSKAVYLTLKASKKVTEGEAAPMRLELSEVAIKDVIIDLKSTNTSTMGAITIAKGKKGVDFKLQTDNDNLIESSSYLSVKIDKVTQEGFEKLVPDRRKHAVLIVDDKSMAQAATLSFTAATTDLFEDDNALELTLKLSQPAQKSLYVTLKSSGDALKGVDYRFKKRVRIAKGQQEAKITITPINDNKIEEVEEIIIGIEKSTDGGLEMITTDETVTLHLHDDKDSNHSPVAKVRLKGPAKLSEPKQSSAYIVSVDQPTTADMVVSLTYSGSASQDDIEKIDQVIISKGSKSVQFKIKAVDDNETEDLESYSVGIAAVRGGGLEHITTNKKSVTTVLSDEIDIAKAFDKIVEDQVIAFELGSIEINNASKDALAKMATLLSRFSKAKLVIEGHTNDIGNETFNKRLSEQRALKIKTYFIEAGIDKKRIKAIGYGESRPLLDPKMPGAQEINKRVEFKVIY